MLDDETVGESASLYRVHATRGGERYMLDISDVGVSNESYRVFVDDGSERGLSIVITYDQFIAMVQAVGQNHTTHYSQSDDGVGAVDPVASHEEYEAQVRTYEPQDEAVSNDFNGDGISDITESMVEPTVFDPNN